MQTKDLSQEKIRLIRELFPNCVTESRERERTVLSVDFDALRQELSGSIVEGQQERYQFTWPDKSKAKRLANTPTTMTLRPCREESVDFDNTKNLYIEGDNLEVLKILRETYLGKIKMIYIDPPYNTGNDFVYNDNYSMSAEEYSDVSGESDNSGNRLFLNSSNNGRFHTDWLNMIYPRLLLAKDLLSVSGSIFISIDDNEFSNLKKVCDEIFGEQNNVATVIWKRKRGRDNSAKWFSKSHEYLLIYAKSINHFKINRLDLDEETISAYKNPDNDPRGPWRMLGCWARGTQGGVRYSFTDKTGHFFTERLWLMSKDKLTALDNDDKLVIRGDNIYRKMFITENEGKIPETLWDDVSNAANASDEIKKIFGSIVFDTPKPTPYIQQMIKIASNSDDIILDFFSGSSTTAEAVLKMNNEDGGNRHFIMVQLPELVKTNDPTIQTICDIGKKRIRHVGSQEKDVCKDVGFRVLECDSSNMKDVFYSPEGIVRNTLEDYVDVIKDDRGSEDLLIQAMLELGVELSSRIEQISMSGHTVFSVDDGYLVACFDDSIDDSTIVDISKEMSGCMYAIFRSDSSMTDDMLANIEQIFKTYGPQTKIRIL